jgi:hypothetical protein
MIDSYWDLYVAYIEKCVRDNRNNDIDPHHYEMEWNHYLPKSIFGDWPIGHWLTKSQHAIASALQTLAFKKNCMFGWHRHYLPEKLLSISWTYFCEMSLSSSLKGNKKSIEVQRSRGTGMFDPEARSEWQKKAHETCKQRGVSAAYDPSIRRKSHESQKKLKVGIHSQTPEEKSKLGSRGVKVTNSQVWESTKDGFRSNSGNVSQHNRRNGWDPDARVRVYPSEDHV